MWSGAASNALSPLSMGAAMGKLTDKQREWLSVLSQKDALCPVAGWGSVANSMLKKGYAEKATNFWTGRKLYCITPAGLAALKETEE